MPDLKKLRICHSSELPPKESRENYLFLLTDTLELIVENTHYTDPFMIVETFPETHVISGAVYISLSGEVKVYYDYTYKDIARIEDKSQLEVLKNLGTTYFLHASRRYLDHNLRLISLPYYNGTYMLTVSIAKDLKINEKTVIRYDPEKEEFYIEGEHEFEDFRRYRSGESSTIKTEVNNYCIHPEVKLDPDPTNILKIVGQGLYAGLPDNVITKTRFDAFRHEYANYKYILAGYIDELKKAVEKAEINISPDTIARKIAEAVNDRYGNMVEVFDKYEEALKKIESFDQSSKEYTDAAFEAAKQEIMEAFNVAIAQLWDTF